MHHMPLFLQAFGDIEGGFGIIFNEQNVHTRLPFCRAIWAAFSQVLQPPHLTRQ
jgi:hypothetical protein